MPGASASSSAVPSTSVQMPTPPTVSPPPDSKTPKDQLSSQTQTSLSSPHTQPRSKPHFSTVIGQVRMQEPSGWTLPIRKNGQKETLL